ncbi:MAG: site-specific integrase [Hyphomicrobiaceae bacterium]
MNTPAYDRQVRLTDAYCKTAPGKAKALGVRMEVRDLDAVGLELRTSPTGARSWRYHYTRPSDGKRSCISIGHYPGIGLEEARRRAAELRRDVDNEKDPAAERQSRREADTLQELVNAWLKQHAEPNKAARSLIDDRSMLDKDILPMLGRMKADQITKGDVVRMLDKVAERGVTVRTNRVLALLRAIYRWGQGRDRVAIDPTAGIKKYFKETARERALSDGEVVTFWERLSTAKMSEGSKLVLKLLLVTAQRESMVCEIARSELDLEAGIWTIPKGRTKSKLNDHMVPLSPLALRLIAEAEALAGDSRWLFPSQRGKGNARTGKAAKDGGPIAGNALGVAVRRTAADGNGWGLPHFTVHDLRRTASTGMGDLDFTDDTIGRVLHHAKKDVTRIYNRSNYLSQRRAALEAWADHLERLLGMRAGGTNVVSLRA